MTSSNLRDGLGTLKRRVIRVGLLSGVGRGLVAALVLILLFAWADLLVELPPAVRLAADAVALAGLIVLLGVAVMRAIRLATPGSLARRVDDVIDTGGQVLAGVDLSLAPQPAGATTSPVTAGLSRIAVDRATDMIRAVEPVSAVPTKEAKRPFMLFGCLAVALIFGGLISPRLLGTQFLRFADPYGDHPPYSRLSFDVAPGATNVIYGKSFDVQVKTQGPTPERVELVHRVAGGADEVLPMFPQTDGKWQATLAGVTSGGEYFVRSGRARSHRYPVDVITVPKIEHVRFRITPPAYTNVGAYEGPLPQAGIAGLPGTKVEMWVKSNRPLRGGSAQLATAPVPTPTTQPTLERAPGAVALAPTSAEAGEVAGSFTISAPGRVSLAVTDVAGQSSTEPFTAPITVLADARPFVRVMEPKPESLATPDVTIEVLLSAEDDYGVSRLQLYRTLNDSRADAAELPVPNPAASRVPGSAPLKLSDHGLSPGDVVKLYARVEDTDPAGPKGSESPIVTLRIISQEDMKRLMLARDAMETLQSKYAEAVRRMEGLDEKLKKLQDELAQKEANDAVDQATRKELEEVAKQAAKDAKAVREAAEQMQLPVDIDKALSKELEKAAERMAELAKSGGEASKAQGMSVAGANDKVGEMRKKLGAAKDELKQEATEPLEHLAKVFPLMEDQARFLELYNRQRDLAERMASLKNSDNVDDPKVKTRMRDLEDEQKGHREELRKLLDDIDDHVAALPADPKLDDLRKTATAFCEAVRASEAAPEMNKAETALSEFSGSRASTSSKEAADILEKFISRCNGMGEQASECLNFQPKLASGMGNSVQQLLESMNIGSGMMGMGAGGGYSARRTSMQNIGLYGNLPTRTEQARSGNGGKADRGAFADGRGKNDDADNDAAGGEQADRTRTTGESADAVPAQYRRSVGEYFQRVADELGEK